MSKTLSPTIMQMEHVNILKKSRSSSKWPMFSTEPWENELSTTQVRDFSTAWLMTFSISKDREIPKTPHTYFNQKRGRCRVISLNDLCLSCLEKVPKIFSKMVVQNGDKSHGTIQQNKHHETSPSHQPKGWRPPGNATRFAVSKRTLGVPTPPSIAQESKDLGPCSRFWQMDKLDAAFGGSCEGFIYPL